MQASTALLTGIIALCTSAFCQARSFDDIHDDAIVIDSHSDFLDRSAIDGTALNDDPPLAQTSLQKLKDGKVDAQFFSVFVPPAFKNYGFAKRTFELIERFYSEIETNQDAIKFAGSASEIRSLANSGQIAALIGIEGGHSIENNLDLLRIYYRLGVRYMTLTWNNTNEWADSSGDSHRWGGLNDFGIRVVEEMNDLGMIIDISHVSDETFWDVLEHSRAPVFASHSLARSLKATPRNMSDDMIRALAKNGGVLQVSFYAKHLDKTFSDRFDAALKASEDRFAAIEKEFSDDPVQQDIALWSAEKALEQSFPAPSMTRVIDHIDHIVGVAGIDHVGIGSDFDGLGAPPVGLEHAGRFQSITRELQHRGYSEADIRKIWGGNLLRVFEAVEQHRGSITQRQRVPTTFIGEEKP